VHLAVQEIEKRRKSERLSRAMTRVAMTDRMVFLAHAGVVGRETQSKSQITGDALRCQLTELTELGKIKLLERTGDDHNVLEKRSPNVCRDNETVVKTKLNVISIQDERSEIRVVEQPFKERTTPVSRSLLGHAIPSTLSRNDSTTVRVLYMSVLNAEMARLVDATDFIAFLREDSIVGGAFEIRFVIDQPFLSTGDDSRARLRLEDYISDIHNLHSHDDGCQNESQDEQAAEASNLLKKLIKINVKHYFSNR